MNKCRFLHHFFSKIKMFRDLPLWSQESFCFHALCWLYLFCVTFDFFHIRHLFFFIFAGDFLRPREFQTTECRVTSDCSETKKRCKSEKGAFTRPAWSSGAYFDSSVISNPSTVPFFFNVKFFKNPVRDPLKSSHV